MLTGKATTHKAHVFGLQTTRGINAGSEYFGIRSVRDARLRYIRNLTPKATFQNAATKDPNFKTWEKMAASGDTNAQKLVHDYQHRPAEELFDCETDPWNRTNLAADPKHAAKLAEMQALLLAEMRRLDDPWRMWNQPAEGLAPPSATPTPLASASSRMCISRTSPSRGGFSGAPHCWSNPAARGQPTSWCAKSG